MTPTQPIYLYTGVCPLHVFRSISSLHTCAVHYLGLF